MNETTTSGGAGWGRWLRNLAIGAGVLYISFRYLVFAAIEKGFTSYGTGAAITQICLVWMLVFAAAIRLSRRLPPAWRFTREDLAFLFVFLLIAGPLMMGAVYFAKQTTYAYYLGDRDQNTQILLEQRLPRHAPDDAAISAMYKGSPDGSVDWAAWLRPAANGLPPLVFWGGFTLFFLGICLSVVLLFRRRWVEEEQLAFPLARMGELLVVGHRSGTTGESLPLLNTRAFWIGCALTFAFQMCTYLSPGLEWRVGSFGIPESVPILGNMDYMSRTFWWRPVYVAMFFLCPRQILGSALFFHLLQCAFTIVGAELGYKGYTGSELPGATTFPFKADQLAGAAVAMSAIMLWLSRGYLKAQALALFRRRRARAPDGQPAASPIALILFLISTAGFIAWTLIGGFSIRTTLIFLACLLLSAIINTRGRAETGMPMILVFATFNPLEWVSILGTKLINARTLAATILHGWIFWNNAAHITPSALDAVKMGQIMRRSHRWVLSIAIAAALIGIALGILTVFDSAYRVGMNKWGFGYGSGSFQTSQAVPMMQRETGVNGLHAAYAGGGAVIVAATWLGRTLLPGFALHPMGYLLSLHSGLHHFSLALIVAYVFKTLSIHYGGLKIYNRLAPCFIGLMVGQILGGVAVGILNFALGTSVYVPMS